jgi:hypothetical protein
MSQRDRRDVEIRAESERSPKANYFANGAAPPRSWGLRFSPAKTPSASLAQPAIVPAISNCARENVRAGCIGWLTETEETGAPPAKVAGTERAGAALVTPAASRPNSNIGLEDSPALPNAHAIRGQISKSIVRRLVKLPLGKRSLPATVPLELLDAQCVSDDMILISAPQIVLEAIPWRLVNCYLRPPSAHRRDCHL